MYKGAQRSRRASSRAAQPRTAWRTARTRLGRGAQGIRSCAGATALVLSPKKYLSPTPAYSVHGRAPATSSSLWPAAQGARASGARRAPPTAARVAGAQSIMRKKSATSYDLVSSVSGWMRSSSSWSFGLSSQDEIGRAYSGWKM